MDTRVGPFTLTSPLGRGGMARVWRAIHAPSGEEVALKIITTELARHSRHVRAFRDEVRAAATLDHPGIVRPLDEGSVPLDFSGHPDITPGTPYMAMELVEGPSLMGLSHTLRWGQIRVVLLDLLDALAHAHSRGIIHRDIKPANVLVDASGEQHRYKLSDFGIARALDTTLLTSDLLDEATAQHRVTGTPRYMAPEQILTEWRDQGPWTDLYAVGCLAYLLVCGRVPYDAPDHIGTFRAHISSPLPELAPRVDVPDGMKRWIHTLLAKSHHHRFQRAADAAWALTELDSAPLVSRPWSQATSPNPADETTVILSTLAVPRRPTQAAEAAEAAEATRAVEALTHAQRVPMPKTRHLSRPRPPEAPALLGAGIALFPLRPVPMTGRDDALDALYEALTRTEQGPAVAVVRGMSGVGKSRVVECLCHRAHELGAATPLRAVHDTFPGPLQGMSGCIGRVLRLGGLDRAAATARALEWMRARGASGPTLLHDAAALAQLSTSEPTDTSSSITFTTPSERHAVLTRLLELLALERPLLVWLDDVQWGLDTLEFASWFLARSKARVLFVATVRDDALPDLSRERDALETLAESALVDLTLDPLSPEAHRNMVARALHLAPDLVSRVAYRTQGNPLFAIQLVGALIERGALSPSPQGFVLNGDEPEIPDSLHELWIERLDRVISNLPDALERWHALELAACLGRTFSLAEWRWVCQHFGLSWSPRLLDRMRRVGLLTLDHDEAHEAHEATFAHPMLQEALTRRAREEDHHAPMHLVCAELALSQVTPAPHTWLRVGHHLIAAHEFTRALPALLHAANHAVKQGNSSAGLSALELHARACSKDPSHDRSSALDADILRGWVATRRGRAQEGAAIAARVIQSALTLRLDDVRGRALILRAHLERMNRPADALSTLDTALPLLARSSEPRDYGKAFLARGWILGRGGDIDAGLINLGKARDVFASIPDPRWVAEVDLSQAYILAQNGQFDAATSRVRVAAEMARHIGAIELEAKCENTLGECARFTRRWADAERHYQLGRTLHEASGVQEPPVHTVNLALCALGAGDLDRAALLLSSLDRMWRVITNQGLEPFVMCARAWWLSHTGRWPELARELGHTLHVLTNVGLVERDLADCLTRTRTACLDAGHHDLAETCDLALETQRPL